MLWIFSRGNTDEFLLIVEPRRLWMVERVIEHREDGKLSQIRGMQAVTAGTTEEAFARASDCIDKWLWLGREGA